MSDDLRQQYERDGYVLLPGVFDATAVDSMRAAIDDVIESATAAARLDDNHAWRGARGEDGGEELVVQAWHNLEHRDARFLQAITHPRLVAALVELLGPDVALHHSKMLYKPPSKGAPFPMHQDAPYFPHAQHSLVAASVHLDDTDEENGCLHVVPGSHRRGELAHEGEYQLTADEWPLESGTAVPARAGDVLLFNYLTIHGSGVNGSERPRRNVLFQYRAAADRPTLLQHVDWGTGLIVAGRQPGFDAVVPDYEVHGYAGLDSRDPVAAG